MDKKYHFNFFDIFEVSGNSGFDLFIAILAIPFLLGLSYLLVAAITFGVCWGLTLPWSWKFAFGIWCMVIGLKLIFKDSKKNA